MGSFVYVLESERDRRLYIGITHDVASQLKRHNAGGVFSTRYRRPLKLLGSKQFEMFSRAREAEVRLKQFKDPTRVRTWIRSESSWWA